MPYEIDKECYQVRISGAPDEIRGWIKEICNAIYGNCNYLSQIKDELDNLEKIIEPFQFTIGMYQRIYFNRDSILYAPNASGEARKFFFEALVEKFFEEARQKIEGK